MIARILIAAIPVTVMLVIEVVLPYWRRRRDVLSRQDESVQTRGDIASTGNDDDAAACRVDGERSAKRWRHYYQVLYQTARTGNAASMDKLGELALARKDFAEAFYWKLMVNLHHGRPSGLSARGVCRAWRDAGCPEPKVDADGSGRLFTAKQAKLSMAVLDLWSGRHVQTPMATVRQMMEEGDGDALLYMRRFGIGRPKS